MNNEHTFALFSDTPGAPAATAESLNGSGDDVEDRIGALLDELDRIVTKNMSRPRAERTLSLLGRVQTRVASLMCDVTRVVAASDPDTDAVEALRRKARLGGH